MWNVTERKIMTSVVEVSYCGIGIVVSLVCTKLVAVVLHVKSSRLHCLSFTRIGTI